MAAKKKIAKNLSVSASRIAVELWQVPAGAVTPFDWVVIAV